MKGKITGGILLVIALIGVLMGCGMTNEKQVVEPVEEVVAETAALDPEI